MTKDDALSLATPVVRHLFTVGAGILALHGINVPGDAVISFAVAAASTAVALSWSFIEKNAALATIVENAPWSALESLCESVIAYHRNGADPQLVTHLATAVTAVAQQELIASLPPQAPPAPVPPSPPSLETAPVETVTVVETAAAEPDGSAAPADDTAPRVSEGSAL